MQESPDGGRVDRLEAFRRVEVELFIKHTIEVHYFHIKLVDF